MYSVHLSRADQPTMTEEPQEDIHQLIYEAIEKGELNTLRTLLEPPLSVDTIVSFHPYASFPICFSLFLIPVIL
jgi:hypothetical protein